MTANQSAPRPMLDSDMRHQVMLLSNHARLRAEDPQPAPGESKNLIIPALAQAEAYTDMAVRLEAVRTLALGVHSNTPRVAEIGLDVLGDVARYARARYETPISYTRDEQALAHSGRCKAYRDMAEHLEALLDGAGSCTHPLGFTVLRMQNMCCSDCGAASPGQCVCGALYLTPQCQTRAHLQGPALLNGDPS